MSSASKTFLFCIPVRFGVFVISILTLIGSSFVAAGLWYTVIHNAAQLEGNNPANPLRVSIIVIAVHSTFIAIASLIGFIGACMRKRILIAGYAGFMWFSLLVNFALGIFYIVQVVQHFSTGANNCKMVTSQVIGGKLVHSVKNVCLSKGATIAVNVIVFLLEFFIMLYLTIIVNRYKHQLTEEARWDYKRELLAAPTPESHPAMSVKEAQRASIISGRPPTFPTSSSAPYYPVPLVLGSSATAGGNEAHGNITNGYSGTGSGYSFAAPQHAFGGGNA